MPTLVIATAETACTNHDDIKEGHGAAFHAVADFGHDLLVVLTCARCKSSISRVGIGPVLA